MHKNDSTRGLRTIPASSLTSVTTGNEDIVCSKLQAPALGSEKPGWRESEPLCWGKKETLKGSESH